MDEVVSLDRFVNPIGGQDVELQEVRFAAGGMPMLRLRIREGKRFTIFDVDAATAARWGRSMADWSLAVVVDPEREG